MMPDYTSVQNGTQSGTVLLGFFFNGYTTILGCTGLPHFLPTDHLPCTLAPSLFALYIHLCRCAFEFAFSFVPLFKCGGGPVLLLDLHLKLYI